MPAWPIRSRRARHMEYAEPGTRSPARQVIQRSGHWRRAGNPQNSAACRQAAAGRAPRARRLPSGLLEELPLDVVRVAEGNNRRAQRVVMQIRSDTITAQHLRELLQLPAARDTDREVIKPDPVLAEPFAGRRTRQRRAQHETARLPYPQPELLAREVLINLQPQDALIKGASTRQIRDVQGDVVKAGKHARHATARHATRSQQAEPRCPNHDLALRKPAVAYLLSFW